eukprot:366460-Chlamydomonas_euryale.AAC.13
MLGGVVDVRPVRCSPLAALVLRSRGSSAGGCYAAVGSTCGGAQVRLGNDRRAMTTRRHCAAARSELFCNRGLPTQIWRSAWWCATPCRHSGFGSGRLANALRAAASRAQPLGTQSSLSDTRDTAIRTSLPPTLPAIPLVRAPSVESSTAATAVPCMYQAVRLLNHHQF